MTIIKFSFFILFLNTQLLSNINIDQKAITIGLSSTLPQSKIIANDLTTYDIYIYKTSSTKKPYYVIYAVNIKKESQTAVLKSIQNKYKDAYISSDDRVQKLNSIDFDKNIFIKSSKNIPRIKKPFNYKNKRSIDTNINLNKRSLFITYVKTKKELFLILKKYKKYNLFIDILKNRSLLHYDRYSAIYIVNINTNEFDNLLKTIQSSYSQSKEEQTTLLKYKHERYQFNKFIKGI